MPCRYCPHCEGLRIPPEVSEALAATEARLKALKLPEALLAEICKRYHVTIADLAGRSRKQRIAWARQEAFYEMRQHATLSFPAIGKIFNRDHTTIMHGVKQVTRRRREAAQQTAELAQRILVKDTRRKDEFNQRARMLGQHLAEDATRAA